MELAEGKWGKGKMTRAQKSSLHPRFEAVLRAEAKAIIEAHPTLGKTLCG